jgi:hypothetical protein
MQSTGFATEVADTHFRFRKIKVKFFKKRKELLGGIGGYCLKKDLDFL